ncbi:MAG: hypothetical protein ACR2FU_02140 [Streptosporangiaceae bacterium]
MIRNFAGLTTFILAVSTLTLTYAAPALASDPFYECYFNQTHCYSIAAAENNYYGAESNFNDNSLTVPSSEVDNGSHMSNEIWLITANATQSHTALWVEFGVARGCSKIVGPGETCSGIGGTNYYMKFWATADQNGGFHFHPFGETSSHDGVNHTFQIWNSSAGNNNDYSTWLGTNGTFTLIGTATDQIYPSGFALNAGMELASAPGIDGNESSTSFGNRVQVYRVGQTTWDVSTLDSGTVHNISQFDDTVNLAMDPRSEFAQGK